MGSQRRGKRETTRLLLPELTGEDASPAGAGAADLEDWTARASAGCGTATGASDVEGRAPSAAAGESAAEERSERSMRSALVALPAVPDVAEGSPCLAVAS